MRIERAETLVCAIPFREPYVTARGSLERREIVLLRLGGDDGSEGLGEGVPLTLRGGPGAAAVATQLRDASERLQGLELTAPADDPLGPAIATMLELARPRRLAPPVLAALECALFDLAARAAGVPLWSALGAAAARPVECNATLVADEPERVAAQAEEWVGHGFRSLKLKAGAGFDDATAVREARAAAGPEARLRIDANEAWRPREAVAFLRKVAEHDVELCEQPVRGLRGMARVARESPVPLAADEAVASEADAHRARQRGACELATAKLSKVGGLGAAAAISRVLPTYLSSALDGPVGIAAAAHCAQVIADPGVAHGLATQRLFAASLARRECELRGGRLHIPSGPGLGVELDPDALDRLTVARG